MEARRLGMETVVLELERAKWLPRWSESVGYPKHAERHQRYVVFWHVNMQDPNI